VVIVHCAGGRSVILLKTRLIFCVDEEAQHGGGETPQATIQKTVRGEKDLNGARHQAPEKIKSS